MQVLITRAEPAASRTANNLKALGYEPVIAPIFKLHDLGIPFEYHEYKNFIFTSANAVEIMQKRGWRPESIDATAWCVGETTANAARELGFTNTHVTSGGGAVLSKHIAECETSTESKFLYPATPDRSFNIEKTLKPFGIKVKTVDIYKLEKQVLPPQKLVDFFQMAEDGVIFAFSNRSAKHLDDIICGIDKKISFKNFKVIAISQTAANILLNFPWQAVYVSDSPSEASMISRLERITLP